ncbi:MAG: AMMECR1 domain-containing protein [Candidatus Altiarchaeales archaeon ex4484_96]|nr:MAG: AMMECR1 domain-containing protein [Candidatus Altiarchaeales archaeon ex4484_96]
MNEEAQVSLEQQRYLLKIARDTIKKYLMDGIKLDVEPGFEQLKEKKGTFVTLEKQGRLRGCMGNIAPGKAIYLSVRDNAINAAFHDPRFRPVQNNELDDVVIELSILSVPSLIDVGNPAYYLDEIVVGKDGIIIKKEGRSATYLPQVWEKIPDKVYFLDSLCEKAYLSRGCWRSPDAQIYRYRVQHFSETDI